MPIEESQVDPSAARHHPVQFSLRSMFLLTAVVAVACSVLFVLPLIVAVPVLLLLVIAVPAVLTTKVVYGTGYQRTFCIGALFPAGVVLFATAWFPGLWLANVPPTPRSLSDFADWTGKIGDYYRCLVGMSWVLSVVVGSLCVAVRWLGEKRPKWGPTDVRR